MTVPPQATEGPRYWLMKSEPSDCSIDDALAAPGATVPWTGVRADPTQFDPASPYHDPKSTPDKPRWLLLDVQAIRKTRLVGLAELRAQPALADMRLLQRGNRLSISPVQAHEWTTILGMAQHR